MSPTPGGSKVEASKEYLTSNELKSKLGKIALSIQQIQKNLLGKYSTNEWWSSIGHLTPSWKPKTINGKEFIGGIDKSYTISNILNFAADITAKARRAFKVNSSIVEVDQYVTNLVQSTIDVYIRNLKREPFGDPTLTQILDGAAVKDIAPYAAEVMATVYFESVIDGSDISKPGECLSEANSLYNNLYEKYKTKSWNSLDVEVEARLAASEGIYALNRSYMSGHHKHGIAAALAAASKYHELKVQYDSNVLLTQSAKDAKLQEILLMANLAGAKVSTAIKKTMVYKEFIGKDTILDITVKENTKYMKKVGVESETILVVTAAGLGKKALLDYNSHIGLYNVQPHDILHNSTGYPAYWKEGQLWTDSRLGEIDMSTNYASNRETLRQIGMNYALNLGGNCVCQIIIKPITGKTVYPVILIKKPNLDGSSKLVPSSDMDTIYLTEKTSTLFGSLMCIDPIFRISNAGRLSGAPPDADGPLIIDTGTPIAATNINAMVITPIDQPCVGLGKGNYRVINNTNDYIAVIKSKNNTNISIVSSNKITKTIHTDIDADSNGNALEYDFYGGDFMLNVTGDFGKLSIYKWKSAYNKDPQPLALVDIKWRGYLTGHNILNYKSNCNPLNRTHYAKTTSVAMAVTDHSSILDVTTIKINTNVAVGGNKTVSFAAGSDACTVASAVSAVQKETFVSADARTYALLSITPSIPIGNVTFKIGTTDPLTHRDISTTVNSTNLTDLANKINDKTLNTEIKAELMSDFTKIKLSHSRAGINMGKNIVIRDFSYTGTGAATNTLKIISGDYAGTTFSNTEESAVSAAPGINDLVVTGTIKFVSNSAFSVSDQNGEKKKYFSNTLTSTAPLGAQ